MKLIADTVVDGPEGTWTVAAKIAPQLEQGDVVALHGELGAGKTCFVQGLGYALGIREPMTSPTFTLANEYDIPGGRLVHMDLYRINSPDELFGLGFEQSLQDGAIIAVEWPERAGDVLPDNTYHVRLELAHGGNARHITIARK